MFYRSQDIWHKWAQIMQIIRRSFQNNYSNRQLRKLVLLRNTAVHSDYGIESFTYRAFEKLRIFGSTPTHKLHGVDLVSWE